MSALLYFFPGAKAGGRALFEAAGLGYAIEGGGAGAVALTDRGPNGMPGAIVAPPSPRGRQALPQAADSARWSEIPGGKAWVGWQPDAPPRPEDLERRVTIPGHHVQLADGREWLVPVARRVTGASGLPRAMRWDGVDWSTGEVLPAYAGLWGAACSLWDRLLNVDAQGDHVTVNVECDAAAAALAVNYRLGPAEISALGLFTTQAQQQVIGALIDLPALEELRGKVEAAAP